MTEEKPIRVGVWCAVSSASQAEPDKVSLAEQERAGREFAQSIGGQVVAIYRVPGHSRDIWRWDEAEQKMDAYHRLREDAEAGRLDVLHVLEMSRLGRDPALSQAAASMLERNGAELYNAASPHVIGQRSIGNKFADVIEMVSSQEEQIKRVHRHRSGMRGRVRRGLFPGTPPTGYRLVRNAQGTTIGAEFDEMIDAVRQCTEMYLRGSSWQEIKAVLDESPYAPPRSDVERGWPLISIRNWMGNDAYAGLPTWGGAQPDRPSTRYPALWDEQTYQEILAERERRRVLMPRGDNSPVLGIAFCDRCKSRMHRDWKSHKHGKYLRCGRHAMSTRADLDVSPCHPNYIKERLVLRAIAAYLAPIQELSVLEELMVQGSPDNRTEFRLGEIERSLADYAQQRKRLALALAAGQMQPDIYAEADEQIRLRVEQLQVERSRLSRRRSRRTPPETRLRAIGNAGDLLGSAPKAQPSAQINVLLHRIGVRVYVEEGEIRDVCIFEDT